MRIPSVKCNVQDGSGVAIAAWIVLALAMLLKCLAPITYYELIQEDALLENLQFVCYFFAGGFAWQMSQSLPVANLKLYARSYRMIALALFLVASEEVSWLQRLFGFETPATMLDLNTQKEFNLHNISGLQAGLHQAYIAVGLLGMLTGVLYASLAERYPLFARCFLPDKKYIGYFFPLAAIYTYLHYVATPLSHYFQNPMLACNGFILWRDQEVAEFLFALGLLVFFRERLRLLACSHMISLAKPP